MTTTKKIGSHRKEKWKCFDVPGDAATVAGGADGCGVALAEALGVSDPAVSRPITKRNLFSRAFLLAAALPLSTDAANQK